jgi:hypothetical protein
LIVSLWNLFSIRIAGMGNISSIYRKIPFFRPHIQNILGEYVTCTTRLQDVICTSLNTHTYVRVHCTYRCKVQRNISPRIDNTGTWEATTQVVGRQSKYWMFYHRPIIHVVTVSMGCYITTPHNFINHALLLVMSIIQLQYSQQYLKQQKHEIF